jgi:CRP-like cAMP-binding protein
MDARLLKEKALQHFQKGKFTKAAEAWAQVCKKDPKDNGTRLRLGDALSKAGQADAAFEAYRQAMEGFARQGFLPQAIAAAKLALALRPYDADIQQQMAGFHAERLGRFSPSSSPSGLSLGGLPSVEPGPAAAAPAQAPFASSPSGQQGGPVARSRPSGMMPGPPPIVSSPSAARQGPSAPPPVDDSADRDPGAPALEAEPDPEPAGDDDAVGALPAGSLGEAEPPTDARAPAQAGRAPRVLPGVRRAELATEPPRSDFESTLVPGEVRAVGPAPAADPSFSGGPLLLGAASLVTTSSDSTVFAVNPFALGTTRLEPRLQRPEPPAEVDGGAPGSFPRIPLFDDLSRDAFLALVQASPLQALPAGAVIIEQDAVGDTFYVICSGRVRVYREEPAGRRELAILEAGAFFGEMAVLTGARRSAWVVAEVDDTRLLEIAGSTLERLAHDHPSVAEGLVSFARRRILSNVMASEPLFSGLKRNERQDWAERFMPRELEAGEVLLAPGAQLPGLAVVVKGQLAISGGRRPGHSVGPGFLLGDVELLSGQVELQARAATRASVLLLGPRDAGALLEHPSNASRRPALLEAGRNRSA